MKLKSLQALHGAPRHLIVCLLSIITLTGACSDDDEPTPVEVCAGACNAQIAGCVQSEAALQSCSTACQAGYKLVPACTGSYRATLDCVGARPFLTCTDDSISLSGATSQCSEELANYLLCAAGSVASACLDAPLGNSQCRDAGLPPRARLCAGGMPMGCQLYEGTLRAGGTGTFCCF
jgi:hypothetical protein